MAYVDPNTVQDATAGQVLQAARLDADRTALEYLARNKPHCRAYNSANINVNTATATALTLNSERYDVGGCHSTSSNTSRLTVPSGEAGKYLIGAGVSWGTNATGYRQLGIRLNGSTFLAISSINPRSDGFCIQAITTEYALSAGDYIEMVVEQNSGGGLNALASGNYSPELWFRWVAI